MICSSPRFSATAVLSAASENIPRSAGALAGRASASGMVLASKYTVLLACPVLLFVIDAPVRARWKAWKWGAAFRSALLLGGGMVPAKLDPVRRSAVSGRCESPRPSPLHRLVRYGARCPIANGQRRGGDDRKQILQLAIARDRAAGPRMGGGTGGQHPQRLGMALPLRRACLLERGDAWDYFC